jgi:hypothetical protein
LIPLEGFIEYVRVAVFAVAPVLTAGEAWYERDIPWDCGKWLLVLLAGGLLAYLL